MNGFDRVIFFNHGKLIDCTDPAQAEYEDCLISDIEYPIAL